MSGPYTFYVRPTPRLSELTYNQAMRMADDETLEQGGEWQHAIMEGLSNAGYVVYRWDGGNTLPKRVG